MPQLSDFSVVLNILKDRITENAHKYFSATIEENVGIKITPYPYPSTNFLFLVEIRFGKIKKTLIAKVTPKNVLTGGGKAEYEMLKLLSMKYASPKIDSFVPRPLDYFDDLAILLMDKIDGARLSDFLKKHIRYLSSKKQVQSIYSLMRECGKRLKTIHSVKETSNTAIISQEIYDKMRHNCEYLFRANHISHEMARKIQSIIADFQGRYGQLQFPLCSQHGDYGVGNIIVADEKIYIIDFTYTSDNLIYNDIGHFIMSIDFLYSYPSLFYLGRAHIRQFKFNFLDGYFSNLSSIMPLDWILIKFYNLRNSLINIRRIISKYSNQRRILLPFIQIICAKSLRKAIDEFNNTI